MDCRLEVTDDHNPQHDLKHAYPIFIALIGLTRKD